MNWLTRPWWRLFRADPWVVVALAVLAFVVALAAAATPRAMSTVADRQLEQTVGMLAGWEREPQAVWNQDEAPRSWVGHEMPEPVGAYAAGTERIRDAQPAPLRDVLGTGQLIRTSVRYTSFSPDFERTGLYRADVHASINPTLDESVELVDGAWPTYDGDGPFEAVLAHEVAELLGVDIGDPLAPEYVLVGTVAPRDPEDPRWQQLDLGDRAFVETDPNLGTIATVMAYLAPDFQGSIHDEAGMTYRNVLWYPVDVRTLTGGVDVAQLQSQLTRMLADSHVLLDAEEASPGAPVAVRFESELGSTLERVIKEQQEAAMLVAIVAAGPVGVAGAVMALGAALTVVRRRPTLDLMTARGASPEQLRTMIGLEGALCTVPAAVAGHLVALAVAGVSPWWAWPVTLLVGLVPAAALIFAIRGLGVRTRSDLSVRGGRLRLTAEIAFLAVTAAATWQLLTRVDAGGGVDLLAVATPMLLAFSAVLLTLRLYPVPLAALSAAFRRGPGIVGHLGAARALRDPAGGLVPTLAVVLGVSVAMLSTVMLGTVTRGAETAVWNEVGASARLSGRATDEVLDRASEIDGVTAAGRISQTTDDRPLTVGGETESVRIWVVDDSMEDVWAGSPLIEAPGPELFTPGAIVTGGEVAIDAGEGTLGGVGDVRVVGHLDTIPGTIATSRWVLVAESTWHASGGAIPNASLAFVRAHPGADLDAVGAELEALVPYSRVSTVAGGLERNAENVVMRALGATFVAAAAGTALLTALALVVVQFMGARSRAELLAVLRTQGMRRGQARGIVAWELGPIAVTAVAVGALLGVGIAALLASSLDLSGLTGSTAAPALYLDPLVLGGVLLAVVGTVAAAVAVSAWLAGRTNLAQALRIGEDR
ncbi:MAG: ABC transporter permease [Propionibacterium sp.]|nr:ABC transporter permease [Propionibacterium sp.]